MKVLQINSVCGIRSTGRIVTDLADEFISQGHECRIAYGRETVPEKYKSISYRISNEFQVRMNALKTRFFDNEGFNAKKETENFIKWANEFDPDLLWLHNLHGYYINVELLFDWIKSRPNMEVRWTFHDCWPFTGHCAHFSYVGCERWTSGCFDCVQKKEYPKSIFRDNSKLNFENKKNAFCGVPNMTLITPSAWLGNLVKQSFLKEYPVKVVNNTIDKTVFKPIKSDFREQNGLKDKKIILGVASAWNEKKGLDDFKKLSKKLDDDCKVVLVGLDKKQISSMPADILCIERTNSAKELAAIYTAADVFVNLTYEDTYPTVNLESQACGTPCLTYKTGGSVESVPTANVVDQGDLDAMVLKIKEFKRKE